MKLQPIEKPGKKNNDDFSSSMILVKIMLICILVICSLFTLFFPACEDMSAYGDTSEIQPKSKQILIIQHQTLPVWRDIRIGYISSLETKRYNITQFNADGNINLLESYIDALVKTKPYDLIISIGSIASQKLLSKEHTVPILVSGLVSPEYSGIISNWEGSGRNFAGAEIRNQTYNGLQYLYNILPFSKIGMVYIIGEPSHEGSLKEIQALANKLNFQVFARGIRNRDSKNNKIPDTEMQKIIAFALANVTPYVDTFYINLSRTFIDNFSVFNDMFVKNKILSIGDKSYLELGCVIGLTSDYFLRGEKLADQTNMILEHGLKPDKIKMDVVPKFQVEYNLEAAKKIEFNPSARFLLNVLSVQKELQ